MLGGIVVVGDNECSSITIGGIEFRHNNITDYILQTSQLILDNSINIKRIIIKLTFDEYGQILEFHWPFYINKKGDFVHSSKIMAILKGFTKDYSKKEPDEINIKYDEIGRAHV